ncbi:hypothetical protein C8R43DRAFT_1125738 [Mycena crocata]|nr:hypothetical protein C8R43DRAFT_1125738 [Mycena crocata]
MVETIRALRARLQELEFFDTADPLRVFLNQSYQGSRSPDPADLSGPNSAPFQEPPAQVIANFVDLFLERFAHSGYFFLDPTRFRRSALLPLGHSDRPSPVLLSAVYMWGSVLSHLAPDVFLSSALRNLHQNSTGSDSSSILEIIQTEILISFYYLHAASPIQGRCHAAVAASLALGANLHLIRSPQHPAPCPPFALAGPVFRPPETAADESERIDAFWAVFITNSFWVGAVGTHSAIPYGIPVHTPWSSSSQAGDTITAFLNGNDAHGSSSTALLAKASLLLERIIAFAARTVGPPDPTALASLDRRLHSFQAILPRLPAPYPLVLVHALVDLAIVRLHAPYTRTSEAVRAQCLSAAARIVLGIGAVNVLDGAGAADPILGPVYACVARVYMNELEELARQGGSRNQLRLRELEVSLGTVMGALASLAAYSPLIGKPSTFPAVRKNLQFKLDRCFVEMRTAYNAISGSR